MAWRVSRRRRGCALLACTLWVCGFEVAPSLHVGLHELLAHHEHGEEAPDGAPADTPEHGEGSIEHRGVAVLEAPPPPVVARVVTVELVASPDASRPAPRDRRPLTIRERGPPVVVFA